VVKTFGLLLALAVLASAGLFRLELIRKEKEGLLLPLEQRTIIAKPASFLDLILSGLFGFLIGFKLVYLLFNFAEFKIDPQGIIFSTKGILLAGIIGALVNAGWRFWQRNKTKLDHPITKTSTIQPHEKLGDITLVAIISGLIGAKLFDLVENLDSFLANPVEAFFSGGGLAIYGGLIVGFLGSYFYLKKLGLPILHMLDAVAPALILGSFVGRLGCHLAGDGCWGIPNSNQPSWWIFPDWLWEYHYPRNVIDYGVPIEGCTWNHCMELSQDVYPTPLYEMGLFALILAVLWGLRKSITTAGVLFCIYLILNGIERYTIEALRVNRRYELLGFDFTQAQIIAICLIFIGIVGWVFLNTQNRAKPKNR
jgi:prolipoprotein diacylglyceryl transferase